MSYKDILICITDEKESAGALNLALTLAQEHQAHLTALVLAYDTSSSLLLPEGGAPGALLLQEMEKLKTLAKSQTARIAETVKAAAAKAGVPVEIREVTPDYEEISDVLTVNARHADFTIMSYIPQAKVPEGSLLVQKALFHSGRPVLLVPVGWKGTTLRRVIAAWDVGREAARAMHEALPLLARAQKVQLLTAGYGRNGGFGEEPGADMALHLSRHGIKVETVHENTETEFPEQILARYAKPERCDVVVMGAYGHSRLREWILGGVTRSMLQESRVPLFMVH